MKQLILKILFFFYCCHLGGQNLVINGDFENTYKIPKNISELGFARPWNSPNFGTPDLFSTKSKKQKVQIPFNSIGNQEAYSGNFYAGIYVSHGGAGLDISIIEFLQGELIEPLKDNQVYQISFYYSLADKSSYSGTSLGVYLSDKRLYPTDKFPKKYKYSVKTSNLEQLSDKTNWIEFSELYKAEGGEKFIIIGEMETETKNKVKRDAIDYVYYYIDNVSVVPVDTVIIEDSIKDVTVSIIPNKEIILTNLYFETGSSTIKNESYQELDNLFEQLNKIITPTDTIVISGHTDDVGKEEDNLKLSENRAKAVAEYLIKKGIAKNKITYVGYGSSKPIADNETEQGREQNRRVELFIKKEIK